MKNLLESFRLRYQVYCQDRKFLSPIDYPDGIESDKWDDNCHHFYYFENDKMVATMRLIPFSSDLAFPTEDHFPFLLEAINQVDYQIETVAEISRLCISRRCTDRIEATMSLFKDLYKCSKKEGITHWIATFERSLFLILKRHGFLFNRLSYEEIEYYGKTNLYGVAIEDLEIEAKLHNPEVYRLFTLPF